jgi:hypothetical protein
VWIEPTTVSQPALPERFLTFPAVVFERVLYRVLARLPARVRHEEHIVGAGAAATIAESDQVDVAAARTIAPRLSYQRRPLRRLAATRPPCQSGRPASIP